MENQRYNGYAASLHEIPSRRPPSIPQHENSVEHGIEVMPNDLGQIDSSSTYIKSISYNTNPQNCDSYLYSNSSRVNHRPVHKKTFIRSTDIAPEPFKNYTNDTDDELAYASASLAYRREELEARLRGHSTIDSVGSNSIRNRQADLLDTATNNLTPTSDVLLPRERSSDRHSLEVPTYNGTNPLKRQYSMDTGWSGNRVTQQRSWDLHNSENIISHNPNGLDVPGANGNKQISRSFDDCSILPSSSLEKSPLTPRKRNLERGVTYHGEDGVEYNHIRSSTCQSGRANQYRDYGQIKTSVGNNPPSYGSETIVRDFKPGYHNVLDAAETNDIGFSYTDEISVRNRRLINKMTNSNGNDFNGTKDPRIATLRQSEKHYDGSYSESKHMGGVGIMNEEMFMEPDYHHLLNPQNESQTPDAYRKMASKNGSMQWWKNQLANKNSTYNDLIGYNYAHPNDMNDSGSNINMYKRNDVYPSRDPNLPDVTVNITNAQHYNSPSGNKSFWSKFNPLGSKNNENEFNTTLTGSSMSNHIMDNNVSKTSHYDQNLASNFGNRTETRSGHYNDNLNSYNNNNSKNISGEGGYISNKNNVTINDQMSYPSMDIRMNNNSYAGFSSILDNQRPKGFNVSKNLEYNRKSASCNSTYEILKKII